MTEYQEMALEMSGVNKSYPHFELKELDLRLPKGTIMGFIGPNGSGKSTTIRILMGLIKADSGVVEVLGHHMPLESAKAKWSIGFVSEDMRLFKDASIAWHMNYLQSIYPDWDDRYAKKLLKKFDLKAGQRIKGLSHGQRVKAGLLLMLARKPALLLLDEPTTGLDPVARHEVLNELMDVLLDENRSILFSSHNTQDIEQLSDQITFLDKGRIISSENKESYLEKWRRIRLELNNDTLLPALAGVVEQRRTGSMAVITAKAFNENMASTYEKCGARIQSIENMTLEEIFVSEVQACRKSHNEEV